MTPDPSPLADVQRALAQRDTTTALALLRQAELDAPMDIDVKLQKAMALRLVGNLDGAIATLDQALAIEPYHFIALLSKGSLVERRDGPRRAAQIYTNALQIVPDPVPAYLQAPIDHARQVIADTTDALEAYLVSRTARARHLTDPAVRARFEEGRQIFAGKTKPYVSDGILLTYPRLPAIPFFDRTLFPWLPRLEAATDMIRAELEAALEVQKSSFAPYIAYPPGAPVNQWEELNHSPRWSSYFLWKDGTRQAEACAQCPGTAALLDSLPLSRQPGFAPTVVFSALDAHTHIPPHTGSTNVRLLVHLPLILPGPARFRVGNEERTWKMGEAWVFDDTIEHEAWNDADALRVIMILDVWNPYLNEEERDLVSTLMLARSEFYSGS